MNLFEANKTNVSKNEMENYLTNSLSHNKKHNLEKAMQNDGFLADAMDGFEKFPNEIKNIPKLKKNNKNLYLISSLSILTVAFLLFFGFKNQFNTREFTPISSNTNKEIIKLIIEKENTTEVSVNDAQKTSEIKHNPIINQTEMDEKTIPFVRETVSLETYTSTPEIYSQKLNYDIKKTKIKTIAYYNFLAIDYSVIYTDNTPFEEIEVGTPASQSNSETYNLTDNHKISKIVKHTYKEYLKKSLNLLSNKNYSGAISNFNTILKHYPNDVNAQFYLGFSYFNLQKHNTAIPFFDKTLNNSFDFFFEDGQWYKALSLEKEGKFKEAKKLYLKIESEKGFYASQAQRK